jgi:hypothetical protein
MNKMRTTVSSSFNTKNSKVGEKFMVLMLKQNDKNVKSTNFERHNDIFERTV